MKALKGLAKIVLGLSLLASAGKAQELTNVVVNVTNDMTLTWIYQAEHKVTATNSGNGTVTGDTDNWIVEGSNATVEAISDPYSYFEKWIGAPAEIETNNPMSYAVLGPTNMVALFKEKLSATNNTPLRWLDKYGLEESDDNLDNDLDGYKTWQEYICDTDPTNRFSYLKGLRINRENGELIVRQPETSLDRDYYLNVSTNLLNSAGWVEKTNAPGNGADIIYNRTPDLDLKAIFYRGGVRLKE